MSNTTVTETSPRVHLSLYRLRQMWIEAVRQIDHEPEGPARNAHLQQLDELEDEIRAAPVEAPEDWAALVDLVDRQAPGGSALGDHLQALAVATLDRSRRHECAEEVRAQFLLGRGIARLRDEMGAVSCRFVIEAGTVAEVAGMLAVLNAPRSA